MADPTDQTLLDAARGGDRDAMGALLSRYEPVVLRFGMKMCGDPEDAKDVLQETLFAAARTARDFRGASSVSSWLYTIARSFCIKKRRRRKGAPACVESLDALTEAGEPAAPGRPPDEALDARRLEAALEEAIAELDPAQREVLVLRDVEGLTAPEVAQVVGASVDAVKSRLHRARVAVRDRVAPLVSPAPEGGAPGCPDVVGILSRHMEGDVGPSVCEEMERHLAGCARCRTACDSLKQVMALCHATPAPAVPASLREPLRRAVRELLAQGRPGPR